MIKAPFSRTFSIRLADGQCWRIVATEGTWPTAERMVRAMGLSESDPGYGPRIVLATGQSRVSSPPTGLLAQYPVLAGLPCDGWLSTLMSSVRMWRNPACRDTIFEFLETPDVDVDYRRTVYPLYPLQRYVIDHGGLPLHTAIVELNGLAAAIVAPSGTGKSTCFRRIRQPWRGVSEEEALVVRVGKQYRVHSLPTMKNLFELGLDESTEAERHLPLSAVFFLEQASKDFAEPMGQGKAATLIYRYATQMCQKYWAFIDKPTIATDNHKLFDTACAISLEVPAFRLGATLTGEFWAEMERVMSKK